VEVSARRPVETLFRRDVNSPYRRALAGDLQYFSGISDVYEETLHPEIVVGTNYGSPQHSLGEILSKLEEIGWISE